MTRNLRQVLVSEKVLWLYAVCFGLTYVLVVLHKAESSLPSRLRQQGELYNGPLPMDTVLGRSPLDENLAFRKLSSIHQTDGHEEEKQSIKRNLCPPRPFESNSSLEEALSRTAINETVILAAFIDSGYFSMAHNFYLTSIIPHNITNVLFLCLDRAACDLAWMHCLPALVFGKGWFSNTVGAYGSVVFQEKSRLKISLVHQVLKLGYNLLLTDVDIHYFQNPLLHIQSANNMDMSIQKDFKELNTGFFFIRATEQSILWYDHLVQALAKWKRAGDDQFFINTQLPKYTKNTGNKFKYQILDLQRFSSGKIYFERYNRFFVGQNPCPDCVVLHNNWIVGLAAKVYRFKENHMWNVDLNQYYSSTGRKYLTYNNPLVFSSYTALQWEKRALQNALAIGNLTGRVVILPKFTYKGGHDCCPLNYNFNLTSFDRHFADAYREHTFLQHPLVPESIKNAPQIILHVSTPPGWDFPVELNTYTPDRTSVSDILSVVSPQGATSQEIHQWLSKYSDQPVIHFDSLYTAFSHFTDSKVNLEYHQHFQDGLQFCDLRQQRPKSLSTVLVNRPNTG